MLRGQFPDIKRDDLLKTLHSLQAEGLVQVEKVANLQGKGTVYYAALKAEWLQSESLEHRAMLDMIEDKAVTLRPIRYPPTHADYPDIVLELAQPKTAVEVETGRKKLTLEESEAWAANVKERDGKLGCGRILVVVPNEVVARRYRDVSGKYGLELTTMAKLLAALGLPSKPPTEEVEQQSG